MFAKPVFSIIYSVQTCFILYLFQEIPSSWVDFQQFLLLVCFLRNINILVICHASLPHFLFNAAFLNTISGSLNDKISPLQLWSSALSFGVAGSLTHVITRSAPACGFSGSLCGLTAFATSVDPVHRYVMIFPVPSLNITNGQLFDMTIVLNIIGHAATKRGYFRNTSFTGHLGGVLAGWLVSELNSLYDPRFKSIMRMRWQRSTLEWKATFGDRWDVFRGLMSSSQSSKRFDYIDLKFW